MHSSQFEPYAHIIWDWNGTLLNDVQLCIDVVSVFLAEQNLPIPSVETYRSIFGFPIRSYYERLGFDLDDEAFEEMSRRYHDIYNPRARLAELHEGARTALESLRTTGKMQSVLSAAAEDHLQEMIHHFELGAFFTRVFGIADIYAVSKEERGLELIAASGHAPDCTLLVGDTDHDLEVGKAMGVDVLLVAHGHQSHDRLQAIHGNVVERLLT